MPDPMTLLKADHREAKKLLEQLADSEPGDERNQTLAQLEQALTLHMQLEEELVYPKTAQEDPEGAEEAEIEHGLAREGLSKLREMVDVPGFGAAVEMLKAGILHHVQEEETELLPEMKSSMDRDEWMAIGDAIAQAKQAAGMPVNESPSSRRKSGTRSKQKATAGKSGSKSR